MEAIACGIPVVTFKTGGSPETLDNTCGVGVDCIDVDAVEREVKRHCMNDVYNEPMCIERAKHFGSIAQFKEYVSLYDTVVGG